MDEESKLIFRADPRDAFAKLPALAKRLGVAPVPDSDRPPSWYARTKGGEMYDIFDLINALLDRLDQHDADQT